MIWTSLIAQGKRRLWMSLFVATFIVLVYFHFARFYQGSSVAWLFTVGWLPVGLNWIRAALGLFYRLDRHPFRLLDLGLATDQVAPGKAFEVEIRAVTRRETPLKKLSAELRCTRQKTTERGRQRAVLSSDEKVLEQNRTMAPGSSETYRVRLPVPEDAAFSFRSMEGKIYWTIHVALSVDGWGELADELEVTVAPG